MRVLLLLWVWFVGGCIAEQQKMDSTDTVQEEMNNDVDEAINRAVKQQDYRLYLTQGRRPVLPGLEQTSVEMIKGHCGTKYLPETGDVIRGEDAKRERISRYNFAKAYNVKMYELCKKLNKDNEL
ncbi:hypothetical protein [Pseudoalteromonas luteoviolacea]|uniref:Lipoprotein n=1 Tax=Pseudoalteromonas luteoviolacea S4060-1 TaxID=1365257 RepID=A0A162BWH8_9GAMM|nr:hypothetical protein [Pseudoalteromonas luteoviolacea]KZN69869.1 hypothetical protein N478_10255 [Pseudoalteromonas luteoviolacea S4060-1]